MTARDEVPEVHVWRCTAEACRDGAKACSDCRELRAAILAYGRSEYERGVREAAEQRRREG